MKQGSGLATAATLLRTGFICYLPPMLMSGMGGLATGDPRLMLASVTSIPIPSALAGMSLELWGMRFGGLAVAGKRWQRAQAVAASALVAAGLAGLLCLPLVLLDVFDSLIMLDVMPSAAIGALSVALRLPLVKSHPTSHQLRSQP
ncbi:hypothetical protein [Devosia sp.]|jgi:hypothetical protein|uniref:hypothetical protein n=1 Tax=Devosia sp. TaxID=1871048 RepID=UPI0037C11C50